MPASGGTSCSSRLGASSAVSTTGTGSPRASAYSSAVPTQRAARKTRLRCQLPKRCDKRAAACGSHTNKQHSRNCWRPMTPRQQTHLWLATVRWPLQLVQLLLQLLLPALYRRFLARLLSSALHLLLADLRRQGSTAGTAQGVESSGLCGFSPRRRRRGHHAGRSWRAAARCTALAARSGPRTWKSWSCLLSACVFPASGSWSTPTSPYPISFS